MIFVEGIQFWAQSYCRSTLAFYIELANYFDVPFRILTGSAGKSRMSYGWDPDEFAGYEIIHCGFENETCEKYYEARKNWHQIFGLYQKNNIFSQILEYANLESPGVGVCSEAPLNMLSPGFRRNLKRVYLLYFLRRRVRHRIAQVDFFVNYSGRFNSDAPNPGWVGEQIIPAGYYPPPLVPSSFYKRNTALSTEVKKTIFISGGASWNRGTDLLPEALKLLATEIELEDIKFVFSGVGQSVNALKAQCENLSVRVEFVGFLDFDKLVSHYETCYAFLALGREEPWGIRVNDALHCGAPLVISKGMGASKIVEEFGCGWTFDPNSLMDFVSVMVECLKDVESYARKSAQVEAASIAYLPSSAAKEIGHAISSRYSNWAHKSQQTNRY